jgi:hypothetical protein
MSRDGGSGSQRKPAKNPKRLISIFVGGMVLLAIVYVGISLVIGRGVRSVSETALREFPGDRISALMALVESDRHSLRDRNRAIWALGQLGAARALPMLEKHYTGKESDERLELSQYELKKAIVLCRGATNISAFVWRRGALATE